MTDHAHELRRYARKIAHPAGDVPAVMLAAADEIERLQARAEAAEKSDVESITMYWGARDERDALRARIEGMEKQEPVALVLNAPKLKRHAFLLDAGKKLPHKANLYAGPGAQPAPSVPEGWKLVPIEPTYEMLEAGEDTLIPTYTDTPVSVPFDVYRAMLAAAPEAKP